MDRKFGVALAIVGIFAVGFSSISTAQSGKPPFAGGGGAPENGKDPAVEKLEAEAAKLAKSAGKSKDVKVRNKVADAYYSAGHTAMVSEKLGRRQKYVSALKHFRKALTFNPNHVQAKQEKDTIEAIYKSMGRPIPN